MDRVEWSESLCIGVDGIDHQHQQLIEIRNRLAASCDAGQEGGDEFHLLLSELFEYTRVHFMDEENFMLSVDYPDLAQQLTEHAQFVDAIVDYSKAASRGDDVRESAVNYLTGWLLGHICGSDMQISRYLAARGAA